MYQISDAMTRNLVSIHPEATVNEAIQLLLDRDISGVPVLDDAGVLVGMITQFQLLEVLYDPDLSTSKVRDFMSKDLITIDETALLSHAANMLILHRIRRLPVLRGGKLVGIVSRGDLLRYYKKSGHSIQQFFGELRKWDGNKAMTAQAV